MDHYMNDDNEPNDLEQFERDSLRKEQELEREESMENEKAPGGAMDTLKLIVDLRRARQTIESQLKDIKQQAKTKINALKHAEGALLDAGDEDENQLKLFELKPQIDPEVQKIIDVPEI